LSAWLKVVCGADGMVISHLPHGPTAYYTLYNAVMRHDIPNLGTMSEQYPHLIFHNFTSERGERVLVCLLRCHCHVCVYGKTCWCPDGKWQYKISV